MMTTQRHSPERKTVRDPPARKLSTIPATREAADQLGPHPTFVPLWGKGEPYPLGVSGGMASSLS